MPNSLLRLILVTYFAISATSINAEHSDRVTTDVFRQLAMEHAECAAFYLASSMCSQASATLATELKNKFEDMMHRANRFATEAHTDQRTLTIYGKEVLEDLNKAMGGDCNGMSVVENKYQLCKALAENFEPRAREILQGLLHRR